MVNERKIDAIRKGKPLKLFDMVLMAAVLVVALLLIFFVVYGEEGSYLSVTYQGEEKYYSLTENQTIDVGGHLKVRIENGYAYVIESDCPNHDCIVVGGKIKYVGQKIVCRPNRIVLKITAKADSDPGWIVT